ncbi:MAG: hypothetical protein PUI01_01690 [Campylobacteraceae bacterium]|nr:hypothetical protein [Campylobacteraceae bacterium]
MTRILEFPIEILGSSWGMTQKAKPEDNREFKIPRDCFASLAMTKILEFLRMNLKFLEIASLHPSMTRILKFLAKKYPAPRASRCEATSGCEAKKKPRNSRIP